MSLRGHNSIVKENCVWRDGSSDDCGKQAVTVQTWPGVADCSKLDRRQPGKLGRRTSTAAYGAQPEMVKRPNVDDVKPRRMPSGRGRRQGTTTLHPWNTYKREGRAYSQSYVIWYRWTGSAYHSKYCIGKFWSSGQDHIGQGQTGEAQSRKTKIWKRQRQRQRPSTDKSGVEVQPNESTWTPGWIKVKVMVKVNLNAFNICVTVD